MTLHHGGFPIRKSADRSLFAAPRSLSQLITSFIGSWCQGIHLMLLFAWTLCSVFLTLLFFELLEFLRNIFQVAVKKLSLSHRFLRFSSCFQLLLALPLSTRRNCNFFTLLCWKTNIFSIFVLNICSFLLFHFYSVFNEHGFNRSFDRLVEMMGIEPMTPCLQGRCSPSWATPPYWERSLVITRSLKIEQQ